MKWIIVVKLPSGSRLAFSRYKDQFALVPIEGTKVQKAFAWDSELEAQEYLDAQLECATDLEKLGPFTIEKCELPV